jgi:hypothetical protein
MLKKIAVAIAVTILSTLMLTNPAFSETWRDAIPNAKLVGQGEFRWFLFDVYGAKLWSERLPFTMNVPFALELTYRRHITSKQFVDSTIDEIKRIFGKSYSDEKLAQWRKELTNMFPDVYDGDQLIGVYLPDRGCLFFNKSEQIAKIDDPELAKAFFAIWLDKRSRDTNLRELLLGENK